MAFMRKINDFILTLVALSLPSIAATIDCNGRPFHCLNSTHFMICVDFGSGVSITMDDFVIPCPPTTVCQATNRFECEFPTVTTTTVSPVVTNSPLAATVNNDVVIDTVSDVTTIPFEEYFNTISTTTVSEGNFITRDAVTTELPVNNLSESEVNVAATDSNINETAITFGVSPNYFTTLATSNIVTDEASVTERIPNVVENLNVIFKSHSNIGEALPNATEIVPRDIDHINLSDKNTVDVTENYESNSTLLETIIGATNFRQISTQLNNSTYDVTEPILSEATESIISIPIDDKQVYLTTLDASPDVVLDDKTIENVTESIPTYTTEYKDLIQFRSNSTLNETMSTDDIVQNYPTTLNIALDAFGFPLNVTNSDLSFNETITIREEQISTAEPILFEAKKNNIPVDVFLDNQTRDTNATESISAVTTEYKHLIQSQSNLFNNKPLYNKTSYDIIEPIFTETTESIISIPTDDKQVYLMTLDASPDMVLNDKTIENVTESIPTNTTEHDDLIQFRTNSTLSETMSTGDIVQNDTTTLNNALNTNVVALNVNNSDFTFNEFTTKYEEQISTAEPALFDTKENTTNIPVDAKQAYLPTLDASPDVVLDVKTIENVTESVPLNTMEYIDLIHSQSNSSMNETMPIDDIVQNDATTLTTALDTNGFALNVNNSDLSFNEITTKYEEQISTTESVLGEAKVNELDDKKAYWMTLDASPDVFLGNKTIDTVTKSIVPTGTTEYRHLIDFQSNSTLNASNSSGDIEQSYTTSVNTVFNTNGTASNVYSSNLFLNEDTTPYYEEHISTAQNNFELFGNTGTEIIQPGSDMANITKPKVSVSTVATTTVNTESVSTNTPNAAINTDSAEEVTVKLNVIESGNKTIFFDNMLITELSFNVSNHYLTSTENSVTSTSDNTYVKPENNTNTTQTENHTSVYFVENVTKTETEAEEIHLVLAKPPSSKETTTIVYGNHSTADNTSTTYTIPNIDTTIAQNNTILHDNYYSARIDEAQKVFTSEINVNDKAADATEKTYILQPVTESTSTPLSNIVHNFIGSDLTNENPQEMTTFINKIELTARGNVTNETLTKNVISSDINNSTKITVTPSNQIVNNRVSVLTADDQINTVKISESTPNYILETATQEADSNTYSNVYYQTDIEEISHNQGVPRNNILPADKIENTPSILAFTTESTKESHFDAILQATSSFNSVSDKMYTTEMDNYLTSTTHSPQPEAMVTTAFDSVKSAVDTSKPVTKENEVEEISTKTLKLEMTSTINENSYVDTEQNTPIPDITNSPQPTAITSSTAFVNTNSTVNQVKQVTTQVVDDKISKEPSLISFHINETAYVATEQNIPSEEVTPNSADLILNRFKYTTTTETANDSVHQESRITMASDFSTTKPSESFALSAQNNREIKETLIATTTSNTATDWSAIPNLRVSNLIGAGVTNFGEKINGITVVDSLTTEIFLDAISKASTDNVLEKYPNTKGDINPENIRNTIKSNTVTEDIAVTEDTKYTEPLRSFSIQRENISKLEIKTVVTDATAPASFITEDINYTENQNKLADTQDRVLSYAQAVPNIPEILLPERFGVDEPNSSVNKTTFTDGLSTINTAVASDRNLAQDEINQQSTDKLFTPKISTTKTLLNEYLTEEDVLTVMPELKTNQESIVKNTKLNGDFANTIYNKFTTSIQESTYQSKLASSTESWREIVVTEAVVHQTRPYSETLITSSKPYIESNDQMSQDVTSLTPKLNLANPSENQYINVPQNMEPATKNILTTSDPLVIFQQVTEPSGIANQDVQLSSVRKSTTQKSHEFNTLKLVQNQGVSSTENHFINVTPLANPSTKTKTVAISTRQSFTEPNTQILPEHHVFKNGEQMEVPTTEKLKVNITPILSPSVKDNKPLVDVKAVPKVISSHNISKDVMPNAKAHLITAVYNSNRTVDSVLKTEFNKVQLNITSTTEKMVTQSSDLDIVMVDVIKPDSPNLGEIATGSDNTHSGILATQKSTSQQVEKRKAIKSVTEDEHEIEKKETPETEGKEKPEVEETKPSNDKTEQLTSTEGIPIKKQANVQHYPPLNRKQKPIQIVTKTRPVDSHVEITTSRYNTKSPVANTHNSTLPVSETSKHNFVCKSNNRGRFSDNGDCRKFYICIGKHEPIKGICPNNTVFSELRKQCTKNLSHCVRNNQFQCVTEGRFSDYLNDHIYYICVHNKANRFIRFKLQCQNGYYLNKTSVRCVLNTESILSTSQQSKSASEASTSNQSVSAKSEKIKEQPKTNKKFECKRSGKFPEPNDCRKYYVCTKLGKSEYRQRSRKCDSDEVYNRDRKKCVDADSYECS